MKSIYLGGNRIFEVYDRETRELLQKHTQIEPVNQTKEEILSSPEAFRDTACIFSTWGMPAFSVQEIRTCLHSAPSFTVRVRYSTLRVRS